MDPEEVKFPTSAFDDDFLDFLADVVIDQDQIVAIERDGETVAVVMNDVHYDDMKRRLEDLEEILASDGRIE